MPLFPGFDTLGTLGTSCADRLRLHWFILTKKIIEKEFALSGSEQNPDLTGNERPRACCGPRCGPAGVPAARCQASKWTTRRGLRRCERSLPRRWCAADERSTPRSRCSTTDGRATARSIAARTARWTTLRQGRPGHGHPRGARATWRQAGAHGQAAPAAGPRGRAADRRAAHMLTRKTLGGLETDLSVAGADRGGSRCPACTPPGRRRVSAAAACTATARWRAPSWAAASSPAAPPAVQPVPELRQVCRFRAATSAAPDR